MATRVSPLSNSELKAAAEFRVTEWLRINATVQAFGLSRPLFKLIALDKIRSVHIKQPGASKGIRLINAQSMRDYIGSFEVAAK